MYDDSIHSNTSTDDVDHIRVQTSTESITPDTVCTYITYFSLYISSITNACSLVLRCRAAHIQVMTVILTPIVVHVQVMKVNAMNGLMLTMTACLSSHTATAALTITWYVHAYYACTWNFTS